MKKMYSLWYGNGKKGSLYRHKNLNYRRSSMNQMSWCVLHTATCIFLPRQKDLFPRCWMIDLRGQSSQLIVLCWEVISPKEKYSSWRHHWLNVECKCIASSPCHGSTLVGQSNFKGPVDSSEDLLWLHYGPICVHFHSFPFLYFNIFKNTHQLTSCILCVWHLFS